MIYREPDLNEMTQQSYFRNVFSTTVKLMRCISNSGHSEPLDPDVVGLDGVESADAGDLLDDDLLSGLGRHVVLEGDPVALLNVVQVLPVEHRLVRDACT